MQRIDTKRGRVLSAIPNQDAFDPPSNSKKETDNRQAQRFRTVLQSARLVGAERQSLCVVRDVSEEGMKARLFGDVDVGERVCVEFKGGRTVFAHIIWIENRFAGMTFEKKINIQEIFSAAAPEYSYRSPRLELDATAVVTFGLMRTTMSIIDISVSGLKLMGGDALIRDEDVTIQIEGLIHCAGKVKWKASDLVGIEFERSISVDKLSAWAAEREFRRSVDDMSSRKD